jgi:hypothetical protein
MRDFGKFPVIGRFLRSFWRIYAAVSTACGKFPVMDGTANFIHRNREFSYDERQCTGRTIAYIAPGDQRIALPDPPCVRAFFCFRLTAAESTRHVLRWQTAENQNYLSSL